MAGYLSAHVVAPDITALHSHSRGGREWVINTEPLLSESCSFLSPLHLLAPCKFTLSSWTAEWSLEAGRCLGKNGMTQNPG